METKRDITFFKNNMLIILLLGVICVLGMQYSFALIIGIAIIVMMMFFSTIEEAFCWSLFLVPNIRIFDNLGTTMIVNMLFVVPLIKYFILYKHISSKVIVMSIFLFVFEFIHTEMDLETSASTIAWVISFILCYCITVDERIHLRRTDATSALVSGILFSTIIYLLSNSWFVENMAKNIFAGYRFEAYGSDPNYFSLYLCLCMASIVGKEKPDKSDYTLLLILIAIGFMTASKMCLLLMIFNIIYLVFFTSFNNSKKLEGNIVFIVILIILGICFKDFVGEFIDNLFKRAGGNDMTMNTLTSGRSDILRDYFEILKSDTSTFLRGQGFSYHLKLTGAGSHNTYLDVVLAWGAYGFIYMTFLVIHWINQYKKKISAKSFGIVSTFPLAVLLINFLDLSCFSAGMFFYVIAYAITQLKPQNIKDDT